MRLGPAATRAEYAALVAVAYLAVPALWLGGLLSIWWWLPLPLAASLVRRVGRESGPALNPVLAETARLHLLFGVLFAGSILR